MKKRNARLIFMTMFLIIMSSVSVFAAVSYTHLDVYKRQYGTKVEIKNINSFREVQKALEKEEKRQRELYEFGEEYKIKQETRRWDAGKGKTLPMRSKEEAHDYRYFPEPDLTPIIIPQEKVDKIEATLPELPIERRCV